jgi:hypothetical protein
MALYGLLFVVALVGSLCLTPPVRALARDSGSLALRRFVLQRQIIQNGITCRKLAADLSTAASTGEAWSALKHAAAKLGFSYVEWTIHPRMRGSDDAPAQRFAERLLPPPGSTQRRETTFAVALAGRGASGQVVFSRSTAAEPLHSELPLLINAVAEHLPRVIERNRKTLITPQAIMASVPDVHDLEWASHDSMTCGSCGSPRLHRSRSRTQLELLRKKLTSRRLYECSACGWRGWKLHTVTTPPMPAPRNFESPDLRGLDQALRNIRSIQRQS